MIYPVILAGGDDTRLWPAARNSCPTQFANVTGGLTLFQRAVDRVTVPGFAAPTVFTGEDYRFVARQQMDAIGADGATLIVEPVRRRSAAAILAAALLHKSDPDALLLVCPCDYVIDDAAAFRRSVHSAEPAARAGQIVLFGVETEHDVDGQGYIQIEGGNHEGLSISAFEANPSTARASDLRAAGDWLLNLGIYFCRADTLLKAFEAHTCDLVDLMAAAVSLGSYESSAMCLASTPFARCPDLSFEEDVLAHVDNRVVIELDCGWSSLDSWAALKTLGDTDSAANVISGNATAIDCEGSLLKSDNPDIKLVGLGLKDIVAVATDDGILVADMAQGEKVAAVVETLCAEGAVQADGFRRSPRPWGYSEKLSVGPGYHINRIMVKPGAKLSLQSHIHRAENWVVVRGAARVTVGNKVDLLTENQSVYVPVGTIHRLENPGPLPLHLIEVQSGNYLGEDDIVRFEDMYDRPAVA